MAAAITATALLVPALMLTGGGLPAAQWWLFVPPLAWLAAGVVGVLDQRQARARDLALGAPARPVLWHPWLVGAITFVLLEGVTLCVLLMWVLITGDLDTPTVVAVGSMTACGTLIMAGTQCLRRARARGAAAVLEELEGSARRGALAAAGATIGVGAVVAGTLWASTLAFSASTAHMTAALLATAPGWALLGLAWLLARPSPPVSGEAPSA